MTITTARLTLRPLCKDDVDAVHKYASDCENTRFMIRLPNLTVEETQAFLTKVDAQWVKDNPEFYEFAVLLRNDLIGHVGIYLQSLDVAEIGWIVDKAYWGRGYATEAAQAVMDFAQKQLHLRKIIAQCDYRNVASQRVMQKLGMSLVDDGGARFYPKRNETARELTYELQL